MQRLPPIRGLWYNYSMRRALQLPAIVAGVCLQISFLSIAGAGDSWPQFRGPNAGHTEITNLPLTWSETEHVKWKTPLPGTGWSSPVVAGKQIWMTTALEEGESLHALCCDLDSGKLLLDVEVFKNAVVPPIVRPMTSRTSRGYCIKARSEGVVFTADDCVAVK